MALKSVATPCPGVGAVAAVAAGEGEVLEVVMGSLAASDAGTSSRVTREPSVSKAAQRRRGGGLALPLPLPPPPPPAPLDIVLPVVLIGGAVVVAVVLTKNKSNNINAVYPSAVRSVGG